MMGAPNRGDDPCRWRGRQLPGAHSRAALLISIRPEPREDSRQRGAVRSTAGSPLIFAMWSRPKFLLCREIVVRTTAKLEVFCVVRTAVRVRHAVVDLEPRRFTAPPSVVIDVAAARIVPRPHQALGRASRCNGDATNGRADERRPEHTRDVDDERVGARFGHRA